MEIVNNTDNGGRVASNDIYAAIRMVCKQRRFDAALPGKRWCDTKQQFCDKSSELTCVVKTQNQNTHN